MSENSRRYFTEELTVTFSSEQRERLCRYVTQSGENEGGFVRRVTLAKLEELGFGLDQKRKLGDLVDESRGDIVTRGSASS